MKKSISLLLALVLLSFCPCGISAADSKTEFHKYESESKGHFTVPLGNNYSDIVLYGAEVYAITENGRVVTANLEEKIRPAIEDWTNIRQILALDTAVFGLHKDGTVSFCMRGFNPDIEKQFSTVLEWKDITALSGGIHIVGLKENGTLVSAGTQWFGSARHYDLSNWNHVVKLQVICGVEEGVIALCSDGTVLTLNANAFGWFGGECNHIADIDCAPYVWLCLKEDGTVLASGANSALIKEEISQWTDIARISAGSKAAGIKKDGTVVTAGWLDAPDLSDWKNIKELVSDHDSESLIGVCENGTVHCCTGSSYKDACVDAEEIETWKDIEKVCIGRGGFVAGLKSDGSLVGCTPRRAA